LKFNLGAYTVVTVVNEMGCEHYGLTSFVTLAELTSLRTRFKESWKSGILLFIEPETGINTKIVNRIIPYF